MTDWKQNDRRKDTDRRGANRQGKYDRRRNRCVSCNYFEEKVAPDSGWCRYHQQPISPSTFACPHFQPFQ